MLDSVQPLLAEHAALQEQLSDASVHANPALAKKLNRRYAELSSIVAAYNQVNEIADDLAAAKELAKEDESFADEVPATEERLIAATEKLRRLLIPRDPDDGRDVIMEIKLAKVEPNRPCSLPTFCACTSSTPTQRVGRPRFSTKMRATLVVIRMFSWLSNRTLPTLLKGFGLT